MIENEIYCYVNGFLKWNISKKTSYIIGNKKFSGKICILNLRNKRKSIFARIFIRNSKFALKTFIWERLRSNQDFGWKLAFWVVFFFRQDLKTPCIKNSEYKSQENKMIPSLISTISYFWSPTLTNFLQSVFVSLFSIVYAPPYSQIIFLWGTSVFLCLVARSWKDFKFLRELLYWRDRISFLGEVGQTIFFHKAIN